MGATSRSRATQATEDLRIERNGIRPDYFATLGIPIVVGREFAWTHSAAASKVAIINETMAQRFLREKPARREVRDRRKQGRPSDIEIVRSSATARQGRSQSAVRVPALPPEPEAWAAHVLRPIRPDPRSWWPPSGEVRARRRASLADVKLLRTQIDDRSPERFLTILSAAFGGLAALLAAIGICGVLAFSVAQRRPKSASAWPWARPRACAA